MRPPDCRLNIAMNALKRKPKAVFTYCFQIWMASLLLGQNCFLIWDSPGFSMVGDWVGFEVYAIVCGLIFSAPAILLFSGGAAFLFLRTWPIPSKRFVLMVWGVFLIWATISVFFHVGWEMSLSNPLTRLTICYIAPVIAGIWILRWPTKMK